MNDKIKAALLSSIVGGVFFWIMLGGGMGLIIGVNTENSGISKRC